MRACGNVENSWFEIIIHNRAVISTAISTGAVDYKSFSHIIKGTFPHFHRPYYYYYV
jgi:hypothetical protein